MKKKLFILVVCLWSSLFAMAQKHYDLKSPDGTVTTHIQVGETLTYDIQVDGRQVMAPSSVSMELSTGVIWGAKAKVKKVHRSEIHHEVESPFTRQTTMSNHCNVLTLDFSGNYSVEFRAYDSGICYRFVSREKKPFQVLKEGVEYNFPSDPVCTVPYVSHFKANNPANAQFKNSFENYYESKALSQLDGRRFCFLPLLVDAGKGVKLCVTESHLENYPGLYLVAKDTHFTGLNAPYPKTVKQGGHNNLQMLVQDTYDYIAKVEKPRTFPWRIAMVSRKDIELTQNNLSYLLGAPSRIEDISWIKPGKVAWDWWNDWNISGVDFKSGINNDTYKYYIDFAASKGIEYVILDEGWAVNRKADLMQVVPEINLKALVEYAKQKNVGLILWAGYWAFDRDMEKVCRHYSEMGIKGFKVDFMDRDDQVMTDFYYRAAEMCARYKLLIDFHGAFKPAGLNRTYPNAINFEGVAGLEQMKWAKADCDQMLYDTQIPFIRQTAGPMDYTQGAMRHACKGRFVAINSEPMSQGTRCHQLGLYMILESPLSMLCDNPSNYINLGGPCTDFIAEVPTVWDETRALLGEMGQYIVMARRKGNTWYVGGITNWTARDVEVPTDFLGEGSWHLELFKDGVNAHRRADDYVFSKVGSVKKGATLTVHMAPGGGFAFKFSKE